MKHYLLVSFFVCLMVLLGACVVTPLAPEETPEAPASLQPTFTATTAVTATTAITIAVTPTGVTPTAALTPTVVATATATLNANPTVTPTTILTPTAAAATAPQGAVTPIPQGQAATIAAILAARPEFSTINSAVAAVNLVNELSGDAPYTLFAPTDDAFAALPPGTLDNLLASPSTLAQVIQNHLLIEEVSSARLVRLGSVLTALGQTLPVTLTAAGVVQVGDATVVEADIEATNGVIHAIDTVLLPPNLVITGTAAADSATAAGQVTATQGVTTVQVVPAPAATATIADVVQTADELAMLETALGAAGLLQALQLPGDLTLFAPTNAAFEALPAGQLQTLLNTTSDLADVVQYHLIADTAFSDELVRLGTALSASSQPLTITVAADGTLQVNDAQIIQADIATSNGVIHVIDAVLTPPAE